MNSDYINPPFNYTGSKFKMLPQLLKEFDYTKPYFIDLFTGGGSVYTNVLDKYEKVLANDIIEDLIGIHRDLFENGEQILDAVKEITPGKNDNQSFLELRNSYNEDKTPVKLWALMLSSNKNMMRFNTKFKYNQTFGKKSVNKNTIIKTKSYIEHIQKYNDIIEYASKSFYDIPVSDDKFMIYADPPYSNTQAGYNYYWNKDDDQKLYDYLKNIDNIGSSFAISCILTHDGKRSPLLDKLIHDGYDYISMTADYSMVSQNGKKDTQEILIKNY